MTGSDDRDYRVGWKRTAIERLATLYNINPERVYDTAIVMLSRPYSNSKGVANYPDFKFNGFHWTEIGNVIVVYKINEAHKIVSIHAVFSALTGLALKKFYGEYDPMDD
ncbi:hypothetical protein ABE504_00350 [Paenibacillus oryzisoli]|uniref:hypothetical protein n=1 Tax=Paenibacillus oryzisoli TaxID=1850517 RepID=UPI003D28C6F5